MLPTALTAFKLLKDFFRFVPFLLCFLEKMQHRCDDVVASVKCLNCNEPKPPTKITDNLSKNGKEWECWLQKNVHRTGDDVVVTRTYTYIIHIIAMYIVHTFRVGPYHLLLFSNHKHIIFGRASCVRLPSSQHSKYIITSSSAKKLFSVEKSNRKKTLLVWLCFLDSGARCPNWVLLRVQLMFWFRFSGRRGESQLNAPQRCTYSPEYLRASGCWQVHTPRTATQINLYENTCSSVAVVILGCWQNDIRNTDIPHSSYD